MLANRQWPNRKARWGLLGICTLIAFLAFAYPMYVIRPFRAQGPGELAIALLVKRWAPLLAWCAVAAATVCTIRLWRDARSVWTRTLCAGASFLAIGFAALTHVNVYEKMFHRIDAPEAMPAGEANLDRDDMVLAIRVEDRARAYPIRAIAYHHIVNDTLGGTPIVATY